MAERHFFLDHQGARLFASHSSPEGECRGAFLLCHPLYEEKKSSHRFLVEVARALATMGWASLRLDYRGWGDSSEALEATSVTAWLEDLHVGYNYLVEKHADMPVGGMGVRMGATFLSQLATKVAMPYVVLIDPLAKGSTFVQDIKRQKLIRAMMTDSNAADSKETIDAVLERGEVVDLDGFALTGEQVTGMAALQLNMTGFDRGMWVQHGPRAELNSKDAKFLAQFPDTPLDVSCVVSPPFWRSVDLADTDKTVHVISRWVKGL